MIKEMFLVFVVLRRDQIYYPHNSIINFVLTLNTDSSVDGIF